MMTRTAQLRLEENEPICNMTRHGGYVYAASGLYHLGGWLLPQKGSRIYKISESGFQVVDSLTLNADECIVNYHQATGHYYNGSIFYVTCDYDHLETPCKIVEVGLSPFQVVGRYSLISGDKYHVMAYLALDPIRGKLYIGNKYDYAFPDEPRLVKWDIATHTREGHITVPKGFPYLCFFPLLIDPYVNELYAGWGPTIRINGETFQADIQNILTNTTYYCAAIDTTRKFIYTGPEYNPMSRMNTAAWTKETIPTGVPDTCDFGGVATTQSGFTYAQSWSPQPDLLKFVTAASPLAIYDRLTLTGDARLGHIAIDEDAGILYMSKNVWSLSGYPDGWHYGHIIKVTDPDAIAPAPAVNVWGNFDAKGSIR